MSINAKRGGIRTAALLGALFVAGCDENGNFALSSGATADQDGAATQTTLVRGERDVERPDIFEVTDRGLWDGRPSLGGVWVAHPDAKDPERVIIRNAENGRSVVGALFRRERENPGPLLQISSDAAEELGVLAGAPTELSVVALRREEVEVPAEENPVVASLAAPVAVEATALDEPEGEAAPDAVAPDVVAVTLPPVAAAAAATAETGAAAASAVSAAAPDGDAQAVDISAVLDTPAQPLPDGTLAQVGVFSVERNARAAEAAISSAGIGATVLTEEIGGRPVWRVVAGPLADDGAITQLREMGYPDVFILEADATASDTSSE